MILNCFVQKTGFSGPLWLQLNITHVKKTYSFMHCSRSVNFFKIKTVKKFIKSVIKSWDPNPQYRTIEKSVGNFQE